MNFNLELIQTYRKQIQQKSNSFSQFHFDGKSDIYKKSLETKFRVKNEIHRRNFLSNNEEVKTGIELTKLKTLNQNSIVNLNLLLQ